MAIESCRCVSPNVHYSIQLLTDLSLQRRSMGG